MWVGNFEWFVEPEELRQLFEESCGPVTSIHVLRRDTYWPFAFVTFENPAHAELARKKMSGVWFRGWNLVVKRATGSVPNAESKPAKTGPWPVHEHLTHPSDRRARTQTHTGGLLYLLF